MNSYLYCQLFRDHKLLPKKNIYWGFHSIEYDIAKNNQAMIYEMSNYSRK